MHDKERRKRAQENSKTLQHIVETTVFLGAQGLPFRGHRENDPSKNPENILACLNLLKKSNLYLEKHLGKKKQKGSRTMTFWKIQEELIKLIGRRLHIQREKGLFENL